MAAPIFGKKWYEKPEHHHKQATAQFEAMVAASRAGTDEGVRQVKSLFF